jgi:hypothetical protein
MFSTNRDRRDPVTATTNQAVLWVALLMIGASSPGLAQPAAQPSRQQLVEQAEQRFRAGERNESLRLLSQILQELRSTPDSARSPEERALLIRALYRRSLIHADAGDRESASRDLEGLLALAPSTIVDGSLVSKEFNDLFRAVRERTVTELEIVVDPKDAEIRVDDRLLDSAAAVAVVAAGPHVVTADRSGYVAARREIEIRPGGRVRLDIRLDPAANAALEELPMPKRWVVRHLHNTGTDCSGRLYLEGDKVGFSSLSDEPHSFLVALAEVREIAGNRGYQGGLKYGGSFHVRLANGANFNFASTAFPADQLVAILQSAMTEHRKR